MRSLRIAYIFALTLLLSITVALGIVAFYKAPIAPQYPTSPTVYSPAGAPQNNPAMDSYNADYKEYQAKSRVYGRNEFIISLLMGVLLVLAGAVLAFVSTAMATGVIFAGGITFSFGQLLLLGSTVASSISRYTSNGQDVSGDLILEFFVAFLGALTLLVIGFWKFRNMPLREHIPQPIPQRPLPDLQ